jgi:exodeoxyribonuclease-3
MRLIVWNCKGAFSRKHALIAGLKPDVLVVPEAGKFDGGLDVLGDAQINSSQWVGENPRKGLGVLSYGEYSVAVHEAYDPRLRWILPLDVRGPIPFTLFAVWTVPDAATRYYAQPLFDTCETYRNLLGSTRVVIAGDFNNNVRFDKPDHPLNFSKLVQTFAGFDLHSLYHLHNGCAHGAEGEPTFFLYHHAAKPYHLDFVFAKPALYSNGFSVAVGAHATWGKVSDHMPMVCSFGPEPR